MTRHGGGLSTVVRRQVWGLPGGRFKAAMTGHLNWVRSAEFSPDQRLAVSGSDDKTVKLWDITSHQCIHSWDGARAPHTHPSPHTPGSLQGEYRAGGRVDTPSQVAPPVGRHWLPQSSSTYFLALVPASRASPPTKAGRTMPFSRSVSFARVQYSVR